MTQTIPTSGLTGVCETLLIPLAVRYQDNQTARPLLPDPMSVTVIDRLQPNLAKFPSDPGAVAGVAARGHIMDARANAFIAANPNATIVNLGAGLCTRYERLKSRPAHWIDVDLPEVEPFWNAAFLPDTDRRFIPSSVTDPALWQRLNDEVSTPVLFIAEGLFMYLAESDVRRIFSEIAQRFAGSEVLLEVMSPFFAKRTSMNPSVAKTTAQFNWGLKSPDALTNWNGIETVLGEWRMMEWKPADGQPLPKMKFPFNLMTKLPLFRNGFRIVHIRIDSGG